MIYEPAILEAFSKLGKSPRGKQVAYCNQIIEAYLERNKKMVVLSAPTGTGKSIIGAVVAEVMHDLLGRQEQQCGSFILMGTNILATQYAETFDGIRDFLQVKGANNYPCHALSTMQEYVGADSCCEKDMRMSKEPDLEQIVSKYCGKCEFAYVKRAKHAVTHLITNYSYYFIDRLFTHQHAKRTITVWDEAHTINDAFAEHCAVYVSDKRLATLAEEITEHLKVGDMSIFATIKKMRDDIKSGHIDDSNYLEKLDRLHEVYTYVKNKAMELAMINLKSDIKLYSKLSKLSKKYGDMACKIGDLLAYDYEHIFELNKELKELSVKPIFVGSMFNTLINSDYQLFMSATVSGQMLIETLGLNPNDLEYIKLPPCFPVENKKVVFLNVEKLNYTTMKDVSIQDKIANTCRKLVERHYNENESGIILTPSFDVTDLIVKHLSKKSKDVKIFHHERGTKLAPLVDKFKEYSEPSVLISPSMFEGLSLDDELSRYQVYVKAPYASLGEKRMKYIADHHKNMYQLATILRIIQGAGRSVRGPEDYAVTYCIDSMLSYLWKSNLNEWKDEFQVSFQTLI